MSGYRCEQQGWIKLSTLQLIPTFHATQSMQALSEKKTEQKKRDVAKTPTFQLPLRRCAEIEK